jgi:LAS superfamily LD-carboxypeptidase LdcB
MSISPKELIANLTETTSVIYKRNKDRSVVKLLDSTVKSLENIMTIIDKFLKSKNVDIGKMANQAKDKGKSILEASNVLVTDVREKGGKQVFSDIKTKISDKFKAFTNNTETGPPESSEEEASTDQPSKIDRVKNTIASLNEKVNQKFKKEKPVEEKKSWLDKAKERSDKRKAEIEAEKKSVKERGAKKPSSWLGKILSGIMTLGGFVVKGLGSIIGTIAPMLVSSIKFLGGFLLKGTGKLLTRLVPALSSGIASSLQSVIGSLIGGAGKGLWAGAKAIGRGALPLLKGAGSLALRGGAMLASGPVGWAVAIGTAAYGGYKLYKYITRNNVADDIYGKLTHLRLRMYGYNEIKKEHFSKLFDLEMLMKDFTVFKNYQVEVKKLDQASIDKVLDIFGITRDEKEKYTLLNTWFMRRFIPAYKAFMSALWNVNNSIFLDTLDKMNQDNLEQFIAKFTIPSSIYKITSAPTFESPEITVTKEEIDVLYQNIVNEVKSKKKDGKTVAEKAVGENKQHVAKEKMKATEANAALKQEALAKVTTNTTPTSQSTPSGSSPTGTTSVPDIGQEGEIKPKETPAEQVKQVADKAAGKLNMAQGDLTPGGNDLQGIVTKLDKTKIYNLDPNVKELFLGMAKEYNALTGKSVPVNEAFRSYDDQAALYKKMPGKAAKPGNSTHELGLAIDVNQNVTRELDSLGLLRKYGFSTSIGGEPWHLEPIGVTVNPGLAKKDMQHRVHAIQASPGKGGGGYGFQSGAKMKSRDTNYQLSIYNANASNPIDPSKIKDKNSDNLPIPSPTASSTPVKSDPIQPSTSYPVTTSTKEPATIASSSPSTSTQTPTATVPSDEGESKPPNLPTTKTPIEKKESTVGLDVTTSSVPTTNGNLDIAKYATLDPIAAIKQAAKMTGMNEQTMINFAKLESSLNPNAKAKTSSASGLFQLIDSTWKELVDKHGKKYGMPPDADKNNPFYNSLMAGEYAKVNLAKLKGYKEGGVEEDTALYMAHFLGLGGANKFFAQLNKSPDAPVETAVSPSSFSTNQSLMKGKTVSGLLATMDAKMDKAAGRPVDAPKTPQKPATGDTTLSSNTLPTQPPASTTAAPSGLSKAAYVPTVSTPTLSNARMDVTKPTPAVNETPPQTTNTKNSMFESSKMETILTQQLSTLSQIANILTSIDGKVGGNNTPPSSPSPNTKTIADSSVNLSRKKITT